MFLESSKNLYILLSIGKYHVKSMHNHRSIHITLNLHYDQDAIVNFTIISHCSYPIYLGYSRCHLMRITVTDYIRAKQVVEERENERKLRLVEESPVLGKFPQNIRQRLAKLISWKILPPSTSIGNFSTFLHICSLDYSHLLDRTPA